MRFRRSSLILDVIEFEGNLYRGNGQHVIEGRIQLDDVDPEFSKNYRPTIVVDYWKANSEADLRLLYSQIDGGKPRIRGEKLNALLYNTDVFVGFSKSQIKHLSEGLQAMLYGFGGGGLRDHSVEQLAYLMQKDYLTECLRVGEYIKNCYGQGGYAFLQRSPSRWLECCNTATMLGR